MTEQLALTEITGIDQARAPRPPASAPTTRPRRGSARRTPTAHPYRLDEHTRQVGLQGVAAARAVLAETTRRSRERDAERQARRQEELARRAAAAQVAARAA